jgi:threonine synthase
MQGLDDVSPFPKQATAAEGIAIDNPVKGKALLQALRESNGTVCTVTEAEIWDMLPRLSRRGIYVEPTSGAAPAAIKQLKEKGLISASDRVVVELTGIGLKATDKYLEHYAFFS